MSVRLIFEPRDLWWGLYWDYRSPRLHIYVCIVPMLPLHIEWIPDRRVRRRHRLLKQKVREAHKTTEEA